jgi:hypothetical protein
MVMAIWTTWTSDRAAIPSPDSSYRKRAHSGPKMRFGSAAATCAKASRQPLPLPAARTATATGHWPLATGHWPLLPLVLVLVRGACAWSHTKFPDRGRLAHTAASRRRPALGSGEVSGWFLAKGLCS